MGDTGEEMAKSELFVYTAKLTHGVKVRYKDLPHLSWILVSQGISFEYIKNNNNDVFIVKCPKQMLENICNSL